MSPAAGSGPTQEDRDYLVIYEEPDPYGLPTDETLVVDIEEQKQVRPQVDIRQRVELNLSNTTKRMGIIGFIITLVGGLLGIGLLVAFAALYPGSFYDESRALAVGTAARFMIVLGAVALALMIIGMLMTNYGKRIQASGNLRSVRIVEKAPHNKVELQ